MRWIAAVAVAFLVITLPSQVQGDHDTTGLEPQVGQDLIAAVREPTFDDEPYVSNLDTVVGVFDRDSGEATAYPIRVLVWHEIVNDVVGGTPIAVTYCPLCRSGVVYERPAAENGEPLVFRVSGYLYRNNLVMYDVQTFSLWPQILGEAINGTWHGTKLKAVTATTETFLEWRTTHPNTKVLARPNPPICFPDGTCYEGGIDYDVDPYERYYVINRTYKDRLFPDERLPPKALVLGLAVDRVAVAYPFTDLEELRVVNDIVDGRAVVITLHNGSAQAFLRGARSFSWDTGRTMVEGAESFDMITGEGSSGALEKVEALAAFWFAWKDHHPNTFVHGVDWPISSPPSELLIPGTFVLFVVGVSAVVAVVRRRRS